MLDLFIKLIEKGIELLKERERSRKHFFDEVAAPLHAAFNRLATEHMTTFRLIYDGLSQPSPDIAGLARVIQRNQLLEKGSVQLLSRLLSEAKSVELPTGNLAEPFQKYLTTASSCLLEPDTRLRPWIAGLQPAPLVKSIAYYSQADQLFEKHLYSLSDVAELRANVEGVIVGFQAFQADVEISFVGLKAACLR